MSTFKESHTIDINDSENVITFTRKIERNTCEHKHIEISAEDNEVLCTDCNVRLNPIWWIQKYLKHLNQVNQRNNRVLAEYREIYKKLENKSKFMCKHCHEVNTIEFSKLPSKAAVIRGISVVEQDYAGMTVDVKG